MGFEQVKPHADLLPLQQSTITTRQSSILCEKRSPVAYALMAGHVHMGPLGLRGQIPLHGRRVSVGHLACDHHAGHAGLQAAAST